jgi:ketose-bisphosphate aldolase
MKYITNASKAFFAFNIWDIASAKAIIDAAACVSYDVILQTSPGIFTALDTDEFYTYIKSYSARQGVNAYLHLDHCRDLHILQAAICANWDSVMLDASHLPLHENIKQVNIACSWARGKNVLVEAEIGQIKGTEEDIVFDSSDVADLDEVREFLEKTEVDLLAVAIGTAHGLYASVPRIRYELVEQVRMFTEIPFVVHGGSGLSDDTLRHLLSYPNVKKINFSTEVKQAYRLALLECEKNNLLVQKGFEPIKIEKCIHDKIMEMAVNKIKLLPDK